MLSHMQTTLGFSLFRTYLKAHTLLRCFVSALLFLYMVACSPESSAPTVEDLVKVSAPTFNNITNALISSPSINYSLQGQCDARAYLTEYSLDGASWTSVECTNSSFQIPVKVTGFIQVWARSKGKFSYTSISIATVRFLLPPTSNSLVAASSSKADSSDKIDQGTQNILASSFEGSALQGGTKRVHTNLPGMVYEE